MYFKLSFRNIRRSFKDYAIYFLTLIFSVSLFYISNSIESQKVMLDIDGSYEAAFKIISKIMSATSVFIAVVMAFLILYANNYLYKRRKKELGLYMLLGMEKWNISKILYLETIVIGVISLAVGLGIGILGSHLLSLFTASLFEVSLKEFVFIFSKDACVKTIISFAVIYIVIAIFNSKSIKKVKLINLLNAAKKNEDVKVKGKKASVLIFILSIITIGLAYHIILKAGLSKIDNNLIYSILLGIIGTFLLFMSFSGFLLKIFQGRKKFYFKDINMFVVRQINSKINTTFISMTFISLMLFVSICTLSAGLLINSTLSKSLKDLTPHDVTAYSYDGEDFIKYFKDSNFDFDKYFSDYHFYSVYSSNVKYSDFLNTKDMKDLENYYTVSNDSTMPIMKLSDLNKELKMLGKDTITLNDDEYIINSDISNAEDALKGAIKDGKTIVVNGKELKPKSNIIDSTFNGALMKSNICTFVVNDEEVNDFPAFNSFLNMEIKKDSNLSIKETGEVVNSVKGLYKDSNFYSITSEDIKANSKGVGISTAYIALYLGITFIIAAAAILAIQQLSESDDNIERYNLLRKIGVEEKTINKSLFNQVGIYFLLPLLVAIIHSIVGLKISKDVVMIFGGGIHLSDLIIVSAIFIVVVYGGYFVATYFGARNIIRKKV